MNVEFSMKETGELMKELSEKGTVFDSEDDFKFSLAWLIKEKYGGDAKIRLEKRMSDNYISKNKKGNERIDIFIELQVGNIQKHIGIELKYFTAGLKCQEKDINLAKQGAENLRRYDALHDVERLEKFKNEGKIDEGFAIWLTNVKKLFDCSKLDKSIKKDPSNKPKYYNFRICDGRTINGKTLNWIKSKDKKSKEKRKDAIEISGNYKIHWEEYDVNCDGVMGNNLFKYAIIEILQK